MMDPRLGTPESDAEAARLREQAAERQRARDRFVRTELGDEPSGEEVHRAQVNAKLLEMRRELSELATKVDRLDPVSEQLDEQLDAIRAVNTRLSRDVKELERKVDRLDQKIERWEQQRGHLLDQFDKLSLRVEKVEEWGEVDDLAVRVKALEERVVERATANQGRLDEFEHRLDEFEHRLDEFEHRLEHRARDTGEAARLGAELARRLDAIARTVDGHTKALEDVQGSDEYVPVEALRTDLESLQTAVQELTKVLVARRKEPVHPFQGQGAFLDKLLTASAADRLPNRSIIIMDGARDAVPVRRVGEGWYDVVAGARVPLPGDSLYRLLWAPEEDG